MILFLEKKILTNEKKNDSCFILQNFIFDIIYTAGSGNSISRMGVITDW